MRWLHLTQGVILGSCVHTLIDARPAGFVQDFLQSLRKHLMGEHRGIRRREQLLGKTLILEQTHSVLGFLDLFRAGLYVVDKVFVAGFFARKVFVL